MDWLPKCPIRGFGVGNQSYILSDLYSFVPIIVLCACVNAYGERCDGGMLHAVPHLLNREVKLRFSAS